LAWKRRVTQTVRPAISDRDHALVYDGASVSKNGIGRAARWACGQAVIIRRPEDVRHPVWNPREFFSRGHRQRCRSAALCHSEADAAISMPTRGKWSRCVKPRPWMV